MASKASRTPLNWSENRGRNGKDIATAVAPDMSTESLNVRLEKEGLGTKRNGSATQAIGGDTFGGYYQLFRFQPGQDETATEVFIVSTDGTTKILRVAAGTNASNLTLKDNVSATPQNVRAAVLNGKIHFAYDSSVDRLHVWDGSTVRRSGLATPAAPTVADTGSGTYPITRRYYRIAWRTKSGSTILRQSDIGTISTAFDPSGSGTHARVTQPTVANEGETHWVIFGAPEVGGDPGSFFELAEVAIGTTTYDDNENPDDYDVDNEPAPDDGLYTVFPSVKFILSTGDRLIGLGAYESSSTLAKPGRVIIGAVLGSTDTDDDERVNNTTQTDPPLIGWIDVQRNSGSEDRGLAGPINNQIMVFQSKGISFLILTGLADKPLRRVSETQGLGAVSQESIVEAEDENGSTSIYWLDPARGPYRYGAYGFEWCGYDVADVWARINLAATTRVAVGTYDPEERAIIFWLATGSSNACCESIKFYVQKGRRTATEGVRGGWVRDIDGIGSALTLFNCIAMLPATLGATMSRNLKPYLGGALNSVVALRRWNDASSTQDGSTSYQAYVESRASDWGRIWHKKRVFEAWVQGLAASVTLTLTYITNFGRLTSRTAPVSMAAIGSETRVIKTIEGSVDADVEVVQFRIGDASAANTALWSVDELVIPAEPNETK